VAEWSTIGYKDADGFIKQSLSGFRVRPGDDALSRAFQHVRRLASD
jgi:hypothetical protein